MAIEDYSDEQVIHDQAQLRTPQELRLGHEYYIRNDLPIEKRALGSNVRVVALDRIEEGWITVEELDVPTEMLIARMEPARNRTDRSLSDTGLIPYSEGSLSGKWNTHYWWVKK